MPEDQRRRMMETAAKMKGDGSGAGGLPANLDMSSMSSVLENPEMMKHVAEMAKNQEGMDGEQAEMMRQAAEQIQANPELGKQMSEMIKNMPPEQMQKMMEMSQGMRGGASKGGG